MNRRKDGTGALNSQLERSLIDVFSVCRSRWLVAIVAHIHVLMMHEVIGLLGAFLPNHGGLSLQLWYEVHTTSSGGSRAIDGNGWDKWRISPPRCDFAAYFQRRSTLIRSEHEPYAATHCVSYKRRLATSQMPASSKGQCAPSPN